MTVVVKRRASRLSTRLREAVPLEAQGFNRILQGAAVLATVGSNLGNPIAVSVGDQRSG